MASDGDGATTTLNPYTPPDAPTSHRKVYRFTELPQRCPGCNRPFLMRRVRRKFRLGTIAFFVFSAVFGIFIVGGLTHPYIGVFVTITLMAWAMKWNNVVRLQCRGCRWSRKFIVCTRDSRPLAASF
jgi:hypothetical protein